MTDKSKLRKVYESIATPEEVASLKNEESIKETKEALDKKIEFAVSSIEAIKEETKSAVSDVMAKNKDGISSISKKMVESFDGISKSIVNKLEELKGSTTSEQKNYGITLQNVAKELSGVSKSISNQPKPVWNFPQYLYSGMRNKQFSPINPAIEEKQDAIISAILGLPAPIPITNYALETGGNLDSIVSLLSTGITATLTNDPIGVHGPAFTGQDANGQKPVLVAGTWIGDGETAQAQFLRVDGYNRLGVTGLATDGFTPAPLSVSIGASSNIIGQVGIDQTTPGTTNGVVVNNIPAVIGASVQYTGSVTALNTDILPSTDVSMYRFGSLAITGTFSATVTIQGSNDGTLWQTLIMSRLFDSASTWSAATTSSTNVINSFPITTKYLRIRGTAYASGQADGVVQLFTYSPGVGMQSAIGNAASGATDSGNPVKVAGKYNSTVPTFTDGQRGDLQISSRGNLMTETWNGAVIIQDNNGIWVGGKQASGASDSGNPVKIGGRYNTTMPTVTDGQRVDAQMTNRGALITSTDQTTHGTTDLVAADITKIGGNAVNAETTGEIVVRQQVKLSGVLRTTQSVTATTSTAATNFGATGSKRNYITGYSVWNNSATDTYLKLQDGSGGTAFWVIPCPKGGGANVSFDIPIPQPTVNTALYFATNDAVTTCFISLLGFQAA